ncbi:MAG: ABC transporter substrate-binding protein [Oscillospiraceae bacterium]
MKKRNLFKVFAAVLALLMVLCSCANNNDAPGNEDENPSNKADEKVDDKKEDTTPVKDFLVYCLSGEPSSMDPSMFAEGVSYTIYYQIYDTLIRKDAEGNLVGGLAESWEFSEDGKELTLKLVEGVKFHNGDTLTAEDVVFTLDHLKNSTRLMNTVTNYDHSEAVDELTVKIYYTEVYAASLKLLSTPSTSILCKRAVEEAGDSYESNPVGTGPYKYVSRTSGEQIVLEAFEDYYRGAPQIKNLTFKIITDTASATIALEKGEVDFIPSASVSDRDVIMSNDKLQWVETQALANCWLQFNHTCDIFSDVRMRLAVCYAIDKEAVMIGCTDGLGTVIETLATPNIPYAYDENFEGLGYDPEKAMELLKECGYEDGVTIRAMINESPNYYKAAEIIKSQLAEVGINMEITKLERATWVDLISYEGDYDVITMCWTWNSGDPDFMTDRIGSQGGQNTAHINNAKLDELLAAGARELDGEKRTEIYQELNELIRDEAIVCPLYCSITAAAANSGLQNVIANASSEYHVYDFYWG